MSVVIVVAPPDGRAPTAADPSTGPRSGAIDRIAWDTAKIPDSGPDGSHSCIAPIEGTTTANWVSSRVLEENVMVFVIV